jgi:hypothetical protein
MRTPKPAAGTKAWNSVMGEIVMEYIRQVPRDILALDIMFHCSEKKP